MGIILNAEQWELLTSILEQDKKDGAYDGYPGSDNARRSAIIEEALRLLLDNM